MTQKRTMKMIGHAHFSGCMTEGLEETEYEILALAKRENCHRTGPLYHMTAHDRLLAVMPGFDASLYRTA